MGVLLLPDGTPQSRISLSAGIGVGVVGEANNNVSGLTDANSLPSSQPPPLPSAPTRVVGIINIVGDQEERRSSSEWMPPPPKKKWIRHYLLGEMMLSARFPQMRDSRPRDTDDPRGLFGVIAIARRSLQG